jgi:DNA polymerase-3 subunit gamma/tau
LLVRVATKQVVSDYESEELFAPELIEKLSKAMSPEDAQLYYQAAITGRRDLHMAPEPRVGFEMTLLRMLVFRPASDFMALAAAPTATSGARQSGAAQAMSAARGQTGGTQGAARSGEGGAHRPPAGTHGASNGPPPQPAAASSSSTGASVAQGGPAGAVASGPWGSIVAQLEISGLARQLANNCVLLGRTGNLVKLGLEPRNNMMKVPGAVDKLAQALSKHFGETVRIEFEAPIAGVETPAQAEQRAVVEEFDSARQALESDPAVRALRETFGATLLPDSVRPLK